MSQTAAILTIKEDESIAFTGDLHADSFGPESRIDDFQSTMISKLEDILKKCIDKNVKALFFPGDMFSRILVPHECVNVVGNVFMKFRKAEIKVFTIVGNHDIARNQLEKFVKSPLKTLFTFEAVENISLCRRVVINKRTLITPVNYVEYPCIANQNAKFNILLAHMYYNASEQFAAGINHNIEEKNVLEWNYDCMVLGHDHVEYPIMKVGRTDIIRPGSVMRATSHEYNYYRIPCFYILRNPAEYNVLNFERIEIQALPFKDVASSSVINKKSCNTLSGLQDVLSNLAERLAGTETDNGGDRIIELIRNDSQIPSEVRALLFHYFGEHGIIV
jgi:DNA repair exonuclease SbcCD nuclease subunit